MPDPDQQQLDILRRAIAALPEPTGTAYRLHLFDGLGYGAIAGRLGLEVAEVEACIAEAILLIDRDLRNSRPG